MTLGVPVGFQITLGEIYNLALRSGYRHLLGSGASSDFIPFALDFAVVIAGQADVGFTVELPNALGTPSDIDRAQSVIFEQRLTIFAQTRL